MKSPTAKHQWEDLRQPTLNKFNSTNRNSSMFIKDAPPIKMKQWALILLFSRRSRFSHKILKISRKMAHPTKTLLWVSLLGPLFNRISRTISISIIIDKEGDRLLESQPNLFPPSRAILYWITRQIQATFNSTCNPINRYNHSKLFCQSRIRCKGRWSNIKIELILHFLLKCFLQINSN